MPSFTGTAESVHASHRHGEPPEEAPQEPDLEVDEKENPSGGLDEPSSGDLQKPTEKPTRKEAFIKFVQADGRPIRWITDRCNGHERVMNPDVKPCCCVMYPNGFLKLMPGLLESNCFMEWFGHIGFIKHDWYKIRRAVFGISMIFSTVGWTCMLFVCLAISKHYNLLQKFDFSHSDVHYRFAWGDIDGAEDPRDVGMTGGNFSIHVGLTAVAWEKLVFNFTFDDYFTAIDDGKLTEDSDLADILNWARANESYTYREETVTSFGSFCDGGSNRVWFVEDCDACRKVSNKLVRNILMSTIFYFFTFKNDWLRFWPNYDVNCQKFMSVCVGSITVALALNVFFQYRGECLASFREGENCFFLNGTKTTCPEIHRNPGSNWSDGLTDEEIDAQFDSFFAVSYNNINWEAGNGMILLGTAIFIRLYSMLSNLTVPTPSITRDRDLQWEYERIAEEEDKQETDLRKSEYFAPW